MMARPYAKTKHVNSYFTTTNRGPIDGKCYVMTPPAITVTSECPIAGGIVPHLRAEP